MDIDTGRLQKHHDPGTASVEGWCPWFGLVKMRQRPSAALVH